MIFIILLLSICGLASLAYWAGSLYITIRILKNVPIVEDFKTNELENWPRLSVIVSARNEVDTIEPAINSRLRDDYPNLEIIIVDDRSDDGTSELVDTIAAGDARVKVVHIKELPKGWLGKLNAMNMGVKESSGEWLLLSDADVYVELGTMKKVISYAETNSYDHLTLLPDFFKTKFMLDTALSIFIRWICQVANAMGVDREDSKKSVGAGAFNLFRRSVFDKTKGFEWLKMEVADDMALGQMLREAGARPIFLNGRGCVGLYFYYSAWEAAVVSERAVYTVLGDFSLKRILLLSAGILIVEVFPFFALLPLGIPGLQLFGVLLSAIALTVSIIMNRWANRPLMQALFMPVGVVLMVVFLVRAGILGAVRKGIYWRGTFYPDKLLKEGRRFKF